MEVYFEQQPSEIKILHLDDDKDLTDLSKTFLEQESEILEVLTENDPTEAIERIKSENIECVVSDYDMPEMDGLEFLDIVRETYPDLPFILYTGKGSEEIASEAISSGVTDYLEKSTGTDQYTVLANRVQNTVAQYRAEQEIERRSKWYHRILKHSSDYVLIVDDSGKVDYVSPAVERVLGYKPEEVINDDAFNYIHPDDREEAMASFAKTISNPNEEVTVEYRTEDSEGVVRWLEVRGSSFMDDPIINGVLVNVRDITERKAREKELKHQNKQLNQFASIVSHDLRNPLHVAISRLELVRDEVDNDHLSAVDRALERMETLIDDMLALTQSDDELETVETIDLKELTDACWRNVKSDQSSVIVNTALSVRADRVRMRQMLENLFRNAIQHSEDDVTVTIGSLPDGFYIEDDGPGIPSEQREEIFNSGYTTTGDGVGLGLSIVKQIVDAHEWDIRVTDSTNGGTRFEFTGVESVD